MIDWRGNGDHEAWRERAITEMLLSDEDRFFSTVSEWPKWVWIPHIFKAGYLSCDEEYKEGLRF